MTALGFALLPSSIVAQQGTLKQQLVGAWTLVSCEAPALQPICVNPNGILIFDPSGRYANVQAARGRPKSTTTTATTTQTRADVTPEYYKAVAQGVVANFGTWSVNEADKTVTLQVEGALFPNGEGTEQKFSVSLTGDELKAGGGRVWRRAK
jgi:hypothetical protein